MATYKGIQGLRVQNLSSDPPASVASGQLWYNSGSGSFKIGIAGAAAWSSGGSTSETKAWIPAAGTQTAAIMCGGLQVPPTNPWGTGTGHTETYDGSTWTEVSDLTTARGSGAPSSSGTQTATLVAGGKITDETLQSITETYNGTAWTEIGDLNTARSYLGGSGTSTAALAIGGNISGDPYPDIVELFNGTAWTEVADLNTGRRGPVCVGTQTATIATSGNPDPTTACEIYNGTAWTEVADINVGRSSGAGGGTTTSCLYIGGQGPGESVTAIVEQYNGTSWTETTNITTGVGASGVGGIQSALVAGCGWNSGAGAGTGVAISQEWNDPVYSIETVTVS